MRASRHASIFVLALTAAACRARLAHENLHAVLWTQSAAEYRALARQSYVQAMAMLDEAFLDPAWTAALEQGRDFSDLPPAVVLDVDETVLDNSAHQARLAG